MARRMAFILFLSILGTPLEVRDRGFQPEDYYEIVSVSDVAVPPSGEYVAFTVTTAVEQAPDDRREWVAPDAITVTLDEERFDGRIVTSMRYKQDGTLTP